MKIPFYSIVACLMLAACTKENDDVVKPISPDDMPLQIVLDEDKVAELEDEDKTEMVFTFTSRFDASGAELGGITKTMNNGAWVDCKIAEIEGFNSIDSYIKGITAYFEVDECTTQEVQTNVDLNTGLFSIEFPANVEELVVEFELDETLFDDGVQNTDSRGFKVEIIGLRDVSEAVVITTTVAFEHLVLDDEVIYGEYELVQNSANFDNFKSLFESLNEDIEALSFADIDKIELAIGAEEIELKLVTTATEDVTECGNTETVNIEIEIEGEFEDLTDHDFNGELEFVVEVEDDEGFIEEVVFKGTFTRNGDSLTLILESEDAGVGPITLEFSR